jgi:ATP-binding cassette subfamily F protein 3
MREMAGRGVAVARKDQKRQEAEQRQARSRERKAQQQVVHRLEKEIQELELRQTEIVSELEKPETYEKPGRAQELNRELVTIQDRLGELNPEWEQAATRLTELD